MDLWINIGPNAFEFIVNRTSPSFFTNASGSLSALLLFFYQYNYFIDLLRYLKNQTNKERYKMTHKKRLT